jgi:hypothetical protein
MAADDNYAGGGVFNMKQEFFYESPIKTVWKPLWGALENCKSSPIAAVQHQLITLDD